ncbi:MAG: FAD-dependent oxidoreductase [Hyphomicrobiaceae bacterium]
MSTGRYDLIVVGAGPAGTNAAIAASEHGLKVVLLDEVEAAGGQVYRAPAPSLMFAVGDDDPDRAAGDSLRARLAAAKVETRFGVRVWSVGGQFRVDGAGRCGPETVEAPRLVAATGAVERVVPFPGWTLPGVMGLAAATVLLKAEAMLPGRRVVVAGCGPLLAAVAAKILKFGGEVAAVVDLAHKADWLKTLPSLIRRPRLLRRGIGWMLTIRGKGVPILFGYGIRRVEGADRVERVIAGPADGSGAEATFAADALTVGHGLVPGNEIPRLYNALQKFDRLRGGWVPDLDVHGRTSIPGLYAAGDGAGLRGADPAAIAGALAGLAAARDAGSLSAETHTALSRSLLIQLKALQPFADAMAQLMALRETHVAAIPPETVVCRCEDVTRAEIDAAAAAGAGDVNQMKHFTRCGMGPCQGRMCGDVAAELVAQKLGVLRSTVGFWAGRPPLRPVPLAALIGDFSYGDIPIPKPAPL